MYEAKLLAEGTGNKNTTGSTTSSGLDSTVGREGRGRCEVEEQKWVGVEEQLGLVMQPAVRKQEVLSLGLIGLDGDGMDLKDDVRLPGVTVVSAALLLLHCKKIKRKRTASARLLQASQRALVGSEGGYGGSGDL